MNNDQVVSPSHSAKSETQGMEEPEYIAVGRIRRPHGLKGAILMEILTDFPDRLRANKKVYIGPNLDAIQFSKVKQLTNALLINFKGYQNIDQVEGLRNAFVYVRTDELPDLPDGEYYHHQLIGITVYSSEGQLLGHLTDILVTGANDVYVVKSENGEEILIPAIEEVVLEIDVTSKKMFVRPLEWY